MKNIANYLIISILIFSCNSRKENNKIETQPQDLKEIKGNQLVAYSDSIPVYSSPRETSNIIGFLRELEVVPRYDYYVNEYGTYSKFDINAHWLPVKFENDTGWVNRFQNVSFECDIDTFNNIAILNQVNLVEMIGIGYTNSQVRIIKTKKNILNQYLNRNTCYPINDSLYIFSLGSDSVVIYNTKSSSFVYKGIGGANVLCKENNCIYYLRWSKDSVDSYGYHYLTETFCQLLQYNIKTNTDTILFTENDIEQRPYTWDPDYRYLTSIQLKDINNDRYIFFELHKVKPDAVDEGDFITKEIQIKIENQ